MDSSATISHQATRKRPLLDDQAGFTLVEILVATTVSIILMLGISQFFASTKVSFRLQDDMTFLEDNARYAFDVLSYNVRLASYWGGSPSASAPSFATAGCLQFQLGPTASTAPVGIQGYAGSAAAVPTGPNQCITSAADYQKNSDILVVRYASPETIYPYDAGLVTTTVGGASYGYNAGTMVMTPQIQTIQGYAAHTNIAQITLYRCCASGIATPLTTPGKNGVFDPTKWSAMANAVVVQGQVSATGSIIQANGSGLLNLTNGMDSSTPYLNNTQLFKSEIFFVRPWSDKVGDNVPTLVSYSLQDNGVGAATPIAEGVEMMRITYGATISPGTGTCPAGTASCFQYYSAAAVPDWTKVTSVQISLVMRSTTPQLVNKVTKTQQFTLSGGYQFNPLFDAATSGITNIQYYLRNAYTKVIQLRNTGTNL